MTSSNLHFHFYNGDLIIHRTVICDINIPTANSCNMKEEDDFDEMGLKFLPLKHLPFSCLDSKLHL